MRETKQSESLCPGLKLWVNQHCQTMLLQGVFQCIRLSEAKNTPGSERAHTRSVKYSNIVLATNRWVTYVHHSRDKPICGRREKKVLSSEIKISEIRAIQTSCWDGLQPKKLRSASSDLGQITHFLFGRKGAPPCAL